MKTARDIMTKQVITVTPETDISEAAEIMLEKHLNGLPVTDEKNQLLGIICQADLVTTQRSLAIPSMFRFMGNHFSLSAAKEMSREMDKISAIKVKDAMSLEIITISPDSSIKEIANIMADKKLYSLPVVDEGRLVGIVGKEDVLKSLISEKMTD